MTISRSTRSAFFSESALEKLQKSAVKGIVGLCMGDKCLVSVQPSIGRAIIVRVSEYLVQIKGGRWMVSR